MTFKIFNQGFVGTSALSMWQDNLIKIPIGLEEKRQTISYGKFRWKHSEVHKTGMYVKTQL